METPRESDPILPSDSGPAGLKTRLTEEASERRALMLLERKRSSDVIKEDEINIVNLSENRDLLIGIAEHPNTDVEIAEVTPGGIKFDHFDSPEEYVAQLSTSKRWSISAIAAGSAVFAADAGALVYKTVQAFTEAPRSVLLHMPITGFDLINPIPSIPYSGFTIEEMAAITVIGLAAGTIAVTGADKFKEINSILSRVNRLRALRDLRLK